MKKEELPGCSFLVSVVVMIGAVAFSSRSAFADGKYFPERAYKVAPAIPTQRAILVYRDGAEKLTIESALDGKGRVFDNIFSERLWRRVKVEEVYLRDYQTVAEATYRLGRYFELYNNQRLHQALGYRTPAEVYGVAVGTPVALRAPSVPTALTYGDESTLRTCNFCLDFG